MEATEHTAAGGQQGGVDGSKSPLLVASRTAICKLVGRRDSEVSAIPRNGAIQTACLW